MKRLVSFTLIFTLGGAFWLLAGRSPQKAASASARTPYDPALARSTVAFWEDRVRRDPQGAIAAANLSAAYLRRYRETGDGTDALRAERAARRSLTLRTRGNTAALHHLALSLMAQHRFAEALAAANGAAAIDPNRPETLYLLAESRMERGDYAAAHAALRRAALVSDDAYGKALRARMAEIDGQPVAALDLYRSAQAEADRTFEMPRETVAWFHLRTGNCLAAMGRADEAEQSFREALDLFPRDYRALAALARLSAGRGDWAATVRWGQRAAKIQPTQEMAALLGDAFGVMGKPQEARRQYALIHSSDAPLHTHNRQHALYNADHNQDLDEALALARRELRVRHDIYAYDTLAWVCYKKGLLPEADARMKQALARGTQDASLFYHAGRIAYARGDPAQAKNYLARALAINPYFHPFAPKEARALLARLRTASQ